MEKHVKLKKKITEYAQQQLGDEDYREKSEFKDNKRNDIT